MISHDLEVRAACACRYAHVIPSCLEQSPTNQYWKKWVESGGTPQQLVAHIERNADYDGLAVGWGIGVPGLPWGGVGVVPTLNYLNDNGNWACTIGRAFARAKKRGTAPQLGY